jgi:hypothetical protein
MLAQPTIGGSLYVKPQDIEWQPTQFDGRSLCPRRLRQDLSLIHASTLLAQLLGQGRALTARVPNLRHKCDSVRLYENG